MTGARLGTIVDTVGVMRGPAAVEEAFEVLVPGEEQPMNSSALSRQTQLIEKRDDSPAR